MGDAVVKIPKFLFNLIITIVLAIIFFLLLLLVIYGVSVLIFPSGTGNWMAYAGDCVLAAGLLTAAVILVGGPGKMLDE